MNINVHIERLVLDGISLLPGHLAILQATIESELSQLIQQQSYPTQSGSTHIHRFTGNPVQISRPVDAASLGRQIASSVHGSITK